AARRPPPHRRSPDSARAVSSWSSSSIASSHWPPLWARSARSRPRRLRRGERSSRRSRPRPSWLGWRPSSTGCQAPTPMPLRARIAEFEPVAETLDDAALRAHGLNSKLSELRARAAEAGGLAETRRLLDMARVSEDAASEKLSELEGAASSAEERSAAAEREFESQSEALRDQRMTVNQVDAERLRWRDRIDDLGRRLHTVRQDVIALTHAAEDRTHRLAAADAAADAATESLPALDAAVAAARADLGEAETESPEEEAEMAEGARKLVALEEARIDARLKTSTLEGNLDLINREVELLTARMEEMRTRMPDGVAP